MTRTAPKNTIMKDNEWDNDDTDNDDRGGGGGDDSGGSFVFREHPKSRRVENSCKSNSMPVGSNASATAVLFASPPVPRSS